MPLPTFADALNALGDAAYVGRIRRARTAVGIAPPERPVVFHGTSAARLETILADGLEPRSERGWQTGPAIAFTVDPEATLDYIDEATLRDGCEAGALVAFHLDPQDAAVAFDDDAWESVVEYVVPVLDAPDDPTATFLRRAFPEETDLRRFLALAEEAAAEPKAEHEARLRSLLPEGLSRLAFTTAIGIHGRLRRPVPARALLSAWSVRPGTHIDGWVGEPVVGEVPAWRYGFSVGRFQTNRRRSR